MPGRAHDHDGLIYPTGSRVVTRRDVTAGGRVLHPRGAVGVVVRGPADLGHSYGVRFPDGSEEALRRDEIVLLAKFKEGEPPDAAGLFGRVILRCVIGSRAYGLDTEDSDTDYRGVFLPPAEAHWSLAGVPEQIDRDETQETYWEFQKFLVLALKANPNVLECLFTPMVESATPLGRRLLDARRAFLSRLAYQTFNGYVASQFKKMQSDIRNRGAVKWKHVMHLLRLLIAGTGLVRDGELQLEAAEHRDRLLAVKRGEVPWAETEAWRLALHKEFDAALASSPLPDRPDYTAADALLIDARRAALGDELP